MAVDMFIKIGELVGESKDSSHAKEIDVLAWSWGMSNAGNTHIGGGSGAGKVNVQDLSITKWVDLASAPLMQACAQGTHIETAKLTIRKAGDTPLEYIVIDLEDILITSISTGGSGGEDRLTENVTLNFAQAKMKYVEQAEAGGAGGDAQFGYNMKENKPV